MQFIDHRGFPDAGVAGDQDQFGRAARDDAVEGGNQGIHIARSPVQLLGDDQPVWRVLFSKRKWIDAALKPPFGKAASKIALEACRRLVALLSRLGEQLHNNGRDLSWNTLEPFRRRQGPSRY